MDKYLTTDDESEVDHSNAFCSVCVGDFGLRSMHDGAAFQGSLARVPPGYDETDNSSQQGHRGWRGVSRGHREKMRETPTLERRHLLHVSGESFVEEKEEADSLKEGK